MSIFTIPELYPEYTDNDDYNDLRIMTFANTICRIIFHKDALNKYTYYKGIQFDDYNDGNNENFYGRVAKYHELFKSDMYIMYIIGDYDNLPEEIVCGIYVGYDFKSVLKEYNYVARHYDVLCSTFKHTYTFNMVVVEYNGRHRHYNSSGFTLPNNDCIVKGYESTSSACIWFYSSYDSNCPIESSTDDINILIKDISKYYPQFLIEKPYKPVINS